MFNTKALPPPCHLPILLDILMRMMNPIVGFPDALQWPVHFVEVANSNAMGARLVLIARREVEYACTHQYLWILKQIKQIAKLKPIDYISYYLLNSYLSLNLCTCTIQSRIAS